MLKSKLAAAVLVALAFGYTSVHAQQASSTSTSGQDTQSSSSDAAADAKKAKKLEQITVTGSLIPQSQIETAQPVITITAQDMKAKGFNTVAQALQQASFSTGSVQGMQSTNSFTTGAETLSMFGLPVGFTKYLIDGRPMGNFPGLYNGSDTFNSISGIPIDMVDHIDILPGGQSSLYGSDAIAGVINIVLKKHIDALTVDARYGWYSDGGGASRRISIADSFTVGKWNSLVGVQFESTQPIWTRDRSLTSHIFDGNPNSPPVTPRDIYLYNASPGDGSKPGYIFADPSNCGNVAFEFGGTTRKTYRTTTGTYYCGSPNDMGDATITLDSKTANLYTHNTFDVSDNIQLYGDLLYNYSEKKFSDGSNTSFWSTSADVAPNTPFGPGYFLDPTLKGGSIVSLLKTFAPEEVGGYQNTMTKNTENSYMLTFGAKGTFGQSNWDYDLGFTHSDDKLTTRSLQRVTSAIEQYYSSHVLGPLIDNQSGFPVFQPNYAAMYNPVSPTDYRGFTSYATNQSKTWDNMVRGQLTNASLFSLPGGDAGVAVVLEGGNQGFDISPDPRFAQTVVVDGNTVPYFYGTSSTPGAGHRSRYAATTELKFPLLQQLTLDVSGRYDSYHVGGQDVSHPTYNLGLEYRPFDTLLLRARYGTAFKVPTLSDEFQRPSQYYNSVNDYLNCARLGFGPSDITNCPQQYQSDQYKGFTSGNPALKPITAKVWSYGFVWAPVEHMSFSVDYLHWDINNEVAQLSADSLSNTQYLCDIKTIDPNSQTCAQAFSSAIRGPTGKPVNGITLLGPIQQINTPKLNVANEQVNALSASFAYARDIGWFGNLAFNFSYSDIFKHTYQDYVQDPKVNELTNPNYSTDFKSKANASLTWTKSEWTSTLFVNRYGQTPNYAAVQSNNYTAKGAGKLPAWILWNASITYNPIKNLGISLLVDNLFNKMPPVDRSYPGINENTPYNTDNYNVFGRAIYLEANYKFGAKD